MTAYTLVGYVLVIAGGGLWLGDTLRRRKARRFAEERAERIARRYFRVEDR